MPLGFLSTILFQELVELGNGKVNLTATGRVDKAFTNKPGMNRGNGLLFPLHYFRYVGYGAREFSACNRSCEKIHFLVMCISRSAR